MTRYAVSGATRTAREWAAHRLRLRALAGTSLTAGNLAEIEGFITPSVNGTVIARFASEVLNSAVTAKAGATAFYQAL